MAVPKKKTSVSRKGLRRGGHTHKLYAHQATMLCPNCQSPSILHHICPTCGHYRGKQVVVIKPPGDETPEESSPA